MLLSHPKVKEACVLGLPDPKYGDEIAALIVGSADIDELQEYSKEQMSSYNVPRIWKTLDNIPRN